MLQNEQNNIINSESKIISINQLKRSPRSLTSDLISKAKESYEDDIVIDHSADPIKNMDDIFRISKYFIDNNRYRDNMLFIVGINFGLRISDLIKLRFSNIINNNLVFKETFPVFEIKTRNTRKKKKNRYISINNAVVEAVTLYLQHTDNVSLSDYMFRSESNRGGKENKPLSIRSVNRIFDKVQEDLKLGIHMSTHTLRKTFCYHQMVMSNNDSRKLLLLQKMLNHSTPSQTLDYIGITEEEIEDAYMKLNLGSSEHNYLMDSDIFESETLIG